MELSDIINILIFIVITSFYITVGSLFLAPFVVRLIEPILLSLFNLKVSPKNRYYIAFLISGISYLLIIHYLNCS